MKWICQSCKAINPQFSEKCHNCPAGPTVTVEHKIERLDLFSLKVDDGTADETREVYVNGQRAPKELERKLLDYWDRTVRVSKDTILNLLRET